jgi:hypothetical protein
VLAPPGPDELDPQFNSALIPNIMLEVLDKPVEPAGNVHNIFTDDNSM